MRKVLTIGVAVATAAPVAAHHSDAGLDMQSLVTLDGTVVEYNWRNPHVYKKNPESTCIGRPTAPLHRPAIPDGLLNRHFGRQGTVLCA